MKGIAAIAAVAMMFAHAASAQTVDLQGCPATKGEARSLIAKLEVKSEKPGGTKSYAADNVRFFGDRVLGIYAEDYNQSWLHIHLPRARSAYMPAMKARYAKGAERHHCGEGYESCYMKMKPGVYGGLHSFDFSNFSGRMEKEGEPDGPYLICFY